MMSHLPPTLFPKAFPLNFRHHSPPPPINLAALPLPFSKPSPNTMTDWQLPHIPPNTLMANPPNATFWLPNNAAAISPQGQVVYWATPAPSRQFSSLSPTAPMNPQQVSCLKLESIPLNHERSSLRDDTENRPPINWNGKQDGIMTSERPLFDYSIARCIPSCEAIPDPFARVNEIIRMWWLDNQDWALDELDKLDLRPQLGTSIWRKVALNEYVNLDFLANIQNLLQWLKAYNLYTEAILTLYPHRREELDYYARHIIDKNETYSFDVVYKYDQARRTRICEDRQLTLLISSPDLESQYFYPILQHRTGFYSLRNDRWDKVAFDEKGNEICNKFNFEDCRFPHCKRSHVCIFNRCGGLHPAKNCPVRHISISNHIISRFGRMSSSDHKEHHRQSRRERDYHNLHKCSHAALKREREIVRLRKLETYRRDRESGKRMSFSNEEKEKEAVKHTLIHDTCYDLIKGNHTQESCPSGFRKK
ncbi:hypothetical protein G9A89_013885 [Geosiphon pyriformis]|nr:hypothetical protein G9A89_013885 [Geosiphon pyriformis]